MDEILLFDFQIAHLARSLTGCRRRQYMSVYNVANLVEPWSIRRSCLTRGVYFHHSDLLSHPVACRSGRWRVGSRIGLKYRAGEKEHERLAVKPVQTSC